MNITCVCGRKHRSAEKWAKCYFRPLWIEGEGDFLAVSCGGRAITLFETEADAAKAVRWMDEVACGGGCIGDHALVMLERG
jgi:hypothetical protein